MRQTPQRIGKYELVIPVGAGGMGEVWEAVDVGPHGFRRKVALKILKEGPSTAETKAALIWEARLGGQLSHPNVASTHELCEVDGKWLVAMELIEGATLRELLRDGGPLPGRAIVEIGIQAAAGLQHIHELREDGQPAGLVHRDVKLSNLLLNRHGVVKLVDLGIAKFGGSGPTLAAGTPGYMAPEQLNGTEDGRADLFALGVVMYTLATGRQPFGNGTRALFRVAKLPQMLKDPEFLGEVDRTAPGLGPIVRLCLEPNPNARWESAAALGRALQGILGRQPDCDTLSTLVASVRGEAGLGTRQSTAESSGRVSGGRQSAIPTPLNELVGRAAEGDTLRWQLAEGPGLVCLHGVGGMGKSRLAIAAAVDCADGYEGGVCFIDLQNARTIEEACDIVATQMGMPELHNRRIRQLGYAMAGRGETLIVLDHAEVLSGRPGSPLSRWRAYAPRATFLVVSRIRPGLPGERMVELGGLPEADGVQLFRARVNRELTDKELKRLPELVSRLDGMPLAIELAASRCRVLGIEQIWRKLTSRFQLLSGGPRDAPIRLRSVRAALDASWMRLKAWERSALEQLTSLQGGWRVEAAETALDLSAWEDAPWVVDVLGSLADHSLIQFDPETERFAMLESVRAYASELRPVSRRAG